MPEEHPIPPTPRCFVAPFLDLFYEAPDFWKLILFQFLQIVGQSGLAMFVIGPAFATEFGDNAGLLVDINCIGTPFVAMLFSAMLGRWSDRHDRRWSAAILVVGGMGPIFAITIFGATKLGIYVFILLCWISGPARTQLSGNPLLWALYSDKLPPKYRALGFMMLSSLPQALGLIAPVVNTRVLSAFPQHYTMIFNVTLLVCFALALLVCRSFSTERPAGQDVVEDAADVSPIGSRAAHQPTYLQSLRNSFRIIRIDAKLVGLTLALSAFTLPDLAATYPSQTIQFQILGLTGAGHLKEQQEIIAWQSFWPVVVGMMVNLFLCVVVHAAGPGGVMRVWLPFTCVGFATPALLFWWSGPSWWILVQVGLNLPATCFPALQALVSLQVHDSKVGETMGAVATCKDLMAFVAPILMIIVMSTMNILTESEEALSRAYAWIFPGCAVVMLLAWPGVLHASRKSSKEPLSGPLKDSENDVVDQLDILCNSNEQ